MSHNVNPYIYLVYFNKTCYGRYLCLFAFECVYMIAIEVYYYFIKPKRTHLYMSMAFSWEGTGLRCVLYLGAVDTVTHEDKQRRACLIVRRAPLMQHTSLLIVAQCTINSAYHTFIFLQHKKNVLSAYHFSSVHHISLQHTTFLVITPCELNKQIWCCRNAFHCTLITLHCE